jgi:Aspartyl protease
LIFVSGLWQNLGACGLTYLPIRITTRNLAEVEGTVLGSTYNFVIDTGAPEAILEPVILKRTRSRYIFSPLRLTLPYAGFRNSPVKFAKVRGLSLGNEAIGDLPLGFAETGNHDYGLLHEYGGLIGASLLWNRHAIIDLGNHALYLMVDKK